jgi:3-oxoacyl-[acyl-carrier-protein] synthase-3
MAEIFSKIASTGSYLPRRTLSNPELAESIDTSDAWIRSMTGIVYRHIAGEGETTTDMAAIAASRALRNAGIKGDQLDLIIVATITPDLVFPSTGALLQSRIAARHVGAFDVSAACSGFLYALAIADSMIVSGKCKTVLIVGSERMSQLIDWTDRSTCVLFGDGAAAAVLVPASRPGVKSVFLHADGSTPAVLCAPSKNSQYLHMDGGIVYRFAVRGLVEGGIESIQSNGLTAAEIDWLIPHQANMRIIEASAKKLGVPRAKLVITVDRHANTSAASIPLALDTAICEGKIRAGEKVLLLSVGGGFTWASSLLQWG